MADFPTTTLSRPPKIVISTNDISQPVGEMLFPLRQLPTAAAAWNAANKALLYPFILESPITVYQMSLFNGVPSGEVDIGIYSYPEGTGTTATRVVSNGKVAMEGENKPQVFDIADTQLGVGFYYMAAVCSTITTATFFRAAPAAIFCRVSGCASVTLSEPVLPSSVTLGAAVGYVPALSVIGRATTF